MIPSVQLMPTNSILWDLAFLNWDLWMMDGTRSVVKGHFSAHPEEPGTGPDQRARGVLNALIKVEADHFPAVMADFLQKGGRNQLWKTLKWMPTTWAFQIESTWSASFVLPRWCLEFLEFLDPYLSEHLWGPKNDFQVYIVPPNLNLTAHVLLIQWVWEYSWQLATSNNIQQHLATSSNIQQHPATSSNIQQHPATSSNI